MTNYTKSYSRETGTPFLKSDRQIIFDTYSLEIKLAILALFLGNAVFFTYIYFFDAEQLAVEQMNMRLLLPVHFFAAVAMFRKPSIRNFAISYSAMLLVGIFISIWHAFNNNILINHSQILFSLPYFALGAISISIIPEVVKTLVPAYALSLLLVFIFNSTQVYEQGHTTLLLSFIFNLIVFGFFLVIMNSTDKRITRLAEKQRAQLDELSFTESLFDFTLTETKQTIMYHNKQQITQHPRNNEFTEITSSLGNDNNMRTTVMNALSARGYEKVNIEDYAIPNTSDSQLLKNQNDQCYFTTISEAPNGTDAVLLTDVSNFARSSMLLNAALNGINLGVLCYDEKGRLQFSRGSSLDKLHNSTFKSINSINAKIFRKKTNVANFQLGDKYYDFSIMNYGDIKFVTHVDVTERKTKKVGTKQTIRG